MLEYETHFWNQPHDDIMPIIDIGPHPVLELKPRLWTNKIASLLYNVAALFVRAESGVNSVCLM